MNATLSSEPYRLPSGILAVVVHGVFFALLYFGFSWQSVPPATRSVQVDMWASLPEEVVVVEPAPPVVEEIAQPEQPAEVVKPDIVLKETKKVVAEPVVPKPKKKPVEIKPVEPKPVVAKPVEQKTVEPNPAALLAEQQAARERAEKRVEAARRV